MRQVCKRSIARRVVQQRQRIHGRLAPRLNWNMSGGDSLNWRAVLNGWRATCKPLPLVIAD